MPFSLRENNADVVAFVKEHGIKTALDVGPGFGTYARIITRDAGLKVTMDAIEIYEPYVEKFGLERLYRKVFINDIRDVATVNSGFPQVDYDLIIFGDVLEHLTADDSLFVWKWASEHAKYGIISVPIIHWPQGGTENPHEAHLQEHMEPKDIHRDYGPFLKTRIYSQTGTFFKEF